MSSLSRYGGPSTSSQLVRQACTAWHFIHIALFADTAQLSFPKVLLVCVKMELVLWWGGFRENEPRPQLLPDILGQWAIQVLVFVCLFFLPLSNWQIPWGLGLAGTPAGCEKPRGSWAAAAGLDGALLLRWREPSEGHCLDVIFSVEGDYSHKSPGQERIVTSSAHPVTSLQGQGRRAGFV